MNKVGAVQSMNPYKGFVPVAAGRLLSARTLSKVAAGAGSNWGCLTHCEPGQVRVGGGNVEGAVCRQFISKPVGLSTGIVCCKTDQM